MWNEINPPRPQAFHMRSIFHIQSVFHKSAKDLFRWKKPSRVTWLFSGLPDWIRTIDLQSRSLTRYPAVPRADGNTLCCNEIWLRQVKSLCDEIFATQMWNVCQGKRGKFHFTSTTSRYFTMVHHFKLWKSISFTTFYPKSLDWFSADLNYTTKILFCK